GPTGGGAPRGGPARPAPAGVWEHRRLAARPRPGQGPGVARGGLRCVRPPALAGAAVEVPEPPVREPLQIGRRRRDLPGEHAQAVEQGDLVRALPAVAERAVQLPRVRAEDEPGGLPTATTQQTRSRQDVLLRWTRPAHPVIMGAVCREAAEPTHLFCVLVRLWRARAASERSVR